MKLDTQARPANERRALLAVDTDRVQDYVYESARLPEVRGASALLDWLGEAVRHLLERGPGGVLDTLTDSRGNRLSLDPREDVTDFTGAYVPEPVKGRTQAVLDDLQALLPTGGAIDVVYSAGGSLLAVVPYDQADAIGECLTRLYRDVTLVASATYAFVPYDDSQFQHCFRVLGRELRRKKDREPQAVSSEFLPGAREERCSSCDLRVSIGQYVRDWISNDRPRPICAACRIKIQARNLPKMAEKLRDTAKEMGKDWAGIYPFAQDLEDVAARCDSDDGSRERKYVAAIYMDGDGMGGRVESQATSAANLGLFSQRLGEAMERAVLETLVRLHPPIEHKEWPFQIVYIGGDDLFLLVPAARALDVSRAIAQRFAQLMAEYALTVSAGVVMCHPHYPIYFLHRMAKALCASAKRRGGGGVDFEILRSGAVASTDPAKLRQRITAVVGGGTDRVEGRSLTMRPYTWSDLDRLLAVYRDLRSADYPKGQLISMASEALKSRLEGSSLYVYQVARAQREERAALTRVASELCASAPPPWRVTELDARDGVRRLCYSTMLGDLVEMYGVVKKEAPSDTPCD